MKDKYYNILLISTISFVLFVVSRNIGMFWDNVLFASKMGNYLVENGLFQWNFPDEFDPGHPPFLAFIQALGWKIIGYKLWVSHLMMLPFVMGLLYQIYILISRYVDNWKMQLSAFLLILADPTLLSELVLVSPEVIQLFFFFLAINGILSNKVWLKTLGLFFLGIVTFRGMMLCAGVFLFEVLYALFMQKLQVLKLINKKFILSYLIGAIPAVSFVTWRLLTKGWLQTHPDSPWVDCWHFTNFHEFLINLLVITHRFFDFGRIAVFIFLGLVLAFNRKLFLNKQVQEVLLLAVTSVFFVAVVSVFSTNPFGHRYFLASYISFILAAFLVLCQLKKVKVFSYLILFAVLITGNFWIYPKRVAQGWSASMAHIPYYGLRDKAIAYLNENQIDVGEVATFFPNIAELSSVDLKGDKRSFVEFNSDSEYVFYSNVYNLSDEQYNRLESEYYTIQEFSKCRISVSILKRK